MPTTATWPMKPAPSQNRRSNKQAPPRCRRLHRRLRAQCSGREPMDGIPADRRRNKSPHQDPLSPGQPRRPAGRGFRRCGTLHETPRNRPLLCACERDPTDRNQLGLPERRNPGPLERRESVPVAGPFAQKKRPSRTSLVFAHHPFFLRQIDEPDGYSTISPENAGDISNCSGKPVCKPSLRDICTTTRRHRTTTSE